MLRMVITLFIVSLLLVLCAVLSARHVLSYHPPTLPPDIQLGAAWTGDRHCGWYYDSYMYDRTVYLSCLDAHGEYEYGITYDTARQSIDRVSVWKEPTTLGSIINAWGAPDYAHYDGYGVELYWTHRSVYTAGKVFTPSTKVYYVAYTAAPYPDFRLERWTGFRNSSLYKQR